MGLTTPEVLSQLSGEIVPFAVPAEEFIEVEHRLQLREEGRLEFLGGKQELIRLGEFDDVDIAMMCHTASDMGERKFAVGGTSNGHVVKYVRFIGRGSHAGGAPHLELPAPAADAPGPFADAVPVRPRLGPCDGRCNTSPEDQSPVHRERLEATPQGQEA